MEASATRRVPTLTSAALPPAIDADAPAADACAGGPRPSWPACS